MLNSVNIQGRLVADPELRTTTTNKSCCVFRIAVEDGKDKCYFFRCVAWEKTAELICKWFKKGKQIIVCGKLIQRTYEDKSGGKRRVDEIQVSEISFCGNASEDSSGYAPAAGMASGETQFRDISPDEDGDLPF